MSAGRRRIAYLTGTRADFGLMQSTLLLAAQTMDVQLLVTGMHLDPAFGSTVNEVRATGLPVAAELPIDVTTRTPAGMAMGVGACLQALVPALERLRPDILLLLGDRGEMLAGAIAALHVGVTTVHVHGGERSGTVDEPVRHAISKLATFHCVATQESRERLIRLGEQPERITVTGAPGVDDIVRMSQGAVDEGWRTAVGLPPGPFVLVVFHPVVQQAAEAERQTQALLQAVHAVGLAVLWAEPNADGGSLGVLAALDKGVLPPGSRRVKHLGRATYLAAMRDAAVLVGNSSSGIIEAASLGTPVVNVGDRQRLRERNANTADVPADARAVEQAVRQAIAHGRYPIHNVYGDGRAAERLVDSLHRVPLDARWLEKVNAY